MTTTEEFSEVEVVPVPALVANFNSAVAEAPKDLATQLTKAYSEMAVMTANWLAQADAIVVTDASHTLGMKQARLLRLELKRVRCAAEAKRKEIKEIFIKGGRAVDSIAAIIIGPIEPVEALLLEKEEFAERQEAKRREELRQARHDELVAMGANPDLYNLVDFDLDQWAALLQSIRDQAAAEAKRKAETEAARVKYIEEQKRLREENERLKREADAAELTRKAAAKAAQDKLDAERKTAAAAMRKSEEDKKALESKLAKERSDRLAAEQKAKRQAEAEAKRVRDEAQAKIDEANRIVREERERVEAAEAERVRKENAEADAKAIEKERLAAAPDLEKLNAYVAAILAVPMPQMTTPRGKNAIGDVSFLIGGIAKFAKTAWDGEGAV